MKYAFRKLIGAGVLSLILFVTAGMSEQANAQSYQDTPLMVIRFNQPNVYYEQALYGAVSRAVEAKPAVRFELVAVAPETSSEDFNQKAANATQQNLNAVVSSLTRMGVPQQRIRVTHRNSPSVTAGEVLIFVR